MCGQQLTSAVKVKLILIAIFCGLISTSVRADVLFSAKAVPALKKGSFVWQVEETRRGIEVWHANPRKRFTNVIDGTEADHLRTKISGIRLSHEDVEFLRTREVRKNGEEDTILLRPFDGVHYYFSILGSDGIRMIEVSNPAFDLEQHPSLEQTARLREVMDFIEELTRIAKKDKIDANAHFAGYYTMVKGGFNESMSIDLSLDGSYILDHELIACDIGPNGEMPITHNREEGTWKFKDGIILLQPKTRTEDFPDAHVFVTSLAHRLLPKRVGFTRLLVNADHPDRFLMKKTPKENRIGTVHSN